MALPLSWPDVRVIWWRKQTWTNESAEVRRWRLYNRCSDGKSFGRKPTFDTFLAVLSSTVPCDSSTVQHSPVAPDFSLNSDWLVFPSKKKVRKGQWKGRGEEREIQSLPSPPKDGECSLVTRSTGRVGIINLFYKDIFLPKIVGLVRSCRRICINQGGWQNPTKKTAKDRKWKNNYTCTLSLYCVRYILIPAWQERWMRLQNPSPISLMLWIKNR